MDQLVQKQRGQARGAVAHQIEIGRLEAARRQQAIAKAEQHPVIVARVRVGERAQPLLRHGERGLLQQRLVQRHLRLAGFGDRKHLGAEQKGAQEVVARAQPALGVDR